MSFRYHDDRRLANLVRRVQSDTHRITRYSIRELRGWDFKRSKRDAPYQAKRRHAAEVLRKWREQQATIKALP